MARLFWPYFLFLLLFSLLGLGDSADSQRALTLIAFEAVGALLNVVGLLLYRGQARGASLQLGWKIALAMIIAADLSAFLADAREIAGEGSTAASIAAGGLVVLLLMLPSYVMNARLAFGRVGPRDGAAHTSVGVARTPR